MASLRLFAASLLLAHVANVSCTDHASVGGHPQDAWGAAALVAQPAQPLFCVVIRTYWGHGDAHGGGLRRLLRSLQRQDHQRCVIFAILCRC